MNDVIAVIPASFLRVIGVIAVIPAKKDLTQNHVNRPKTAIF